MGWIALLQVLGSWEVPLNYSFVHRKVVKDQYLYPDNLFKKTQMKRNVFILVLAMLVLYACGSVKVVSTWTAEEPAVDQLPVFIPSLLIMGW